jgi:tetratricopeptide (TPR) repeat protein
MHANEHLSRCTGGLLRLAAGELGQVEEHLSWLTSSARTVAHTRHARCLASDLARARGELDQALQFAPQAHEHEHGWAEAAAEQRVVTILRELDRYEEAFDWLERGLSRLGPTPAAGPLAPLLVERAALLTQLGRLQEASHTLDRVAELLVDCRGELYGLACVWRAQVLWGCRQDGQGALDEALAVLRGRTTGRLHQEIERCLHSRR